MTSKQPSPDKKPNRAVRRDVLVAAGLCIFAWLLLAATAADVGLTYDEPVYMGRADLVQKWLALLVTSPSAALSRRAIELYWPPKDMQPPLVKLTAAVTGPLCLALHLLPAWAAPLVWLRTGTIFWVGLALAIIYLLLRSAGTGPAAACFGPLTLLFLPRVFGHSHLLALDAPAMSTCLIALAVAYWALERDCLLSLLLAGFCFGLAMATKLNGFFVPLAVIPYAIAVRPRRAALLAASMIVIGPLVFLALWPWLWFDTVDHLRQYLAFHWHHWKIGVLYFGRVWTQAPWHYPLVMTAVTTPLIPLLLSLAGLARWGQLLARAFSLRRAAAFAQANDRDNAQGQRLALSAADRLWLLAGLAAMANIAPSMLPSAPKYGGVRLFLPLFGPLALLAALVFHRLFVRLTSAARLDQSRASMVGALMLLIGIAPSLGHIAHFHPFELSYYNALIGGLPGAVARGFEPTYWGETYLAAAAWLNSNAPPAARVWIDPPGVESIMRMYKYLGRLRPDIKTLAGEDTFSQADFVVSQNKPTEFSGHVKQLVRHQKPLWTDGLDGVPLVFLWKLR